MRITRPTHDTHLTHSHPPLPHPSTSKHTQDEARCAAREAAAAAAGVNLYEEGSDSEPVGAARLRSGADSSSSSISEGSDSDETRGAESVSGADLGSQQSGSGWDEEGEGVGSIGDELLDDEGDLDLDDLSPEDLASLTEVSVLLWC